MSLYTPCYVLRPQFDPLVFSFIFVFLSILCKFTFLEMLRLYALLCVRHFVREAFCESSLSNVWEQANEAISRKQQQRRNTEWSIRWEIESAKGTKRKPSLWKSKCLHMHTFICRVSFQWQWVHYLHLQQYQMFIIWPLHCILFVCNLFRWLYY